MQYLYPENYKLYYNKKKRPKYRNQKTQYYVDVISQQINQEIKYHADPSHILCRKWQADSTMYMQMQRSKNSPNNFEKE